MSKDDAPSTHFRLSIVMLWISLQICVQTLIHDCAGCLTKSAASLDDIAVSQFFKRARMAQMPSRGPMLSQGNKFSLSNLRQFSSFL
jgi:hypothetical protein